MESSSVSSDTNDSVSSDANDSGSSSEESIYTSIDESIYTSNESSSRDSSDEEVNVSAPDVVQPIWERYKGMGSRFKAVIISLSWDGNSKTPKKLDNYESALNEWVIAYDSDTEPLRTRCICSHEIVDNCQMRNTKTGRVIVVGNHCVNKFGTLEMQEDAKSVKRLKQLYDGKRDICRACCKRRVGVSDSRPRCKKCYKQGAKLSPIYKEYISSKKIDNIRSVSIKSKAINRRSSLSSETNSDVSEEDNRVLKRCRVSICKGQCFRRYGGPTRYGYCQYKVCEEGCELTKCTNYERCGNSYPLHIMEKGYCGDCNNTLRTYGKLKFDYKYTGKSCPLCQRPTVDKDPWRTTCIECYKKGCNWRRCNACGDFTVFATQKEGEDCQHCTQKNTRVLPQQPMGKACTECGQKTVGTGIGWTKCKPCYFRTKGR